MSEDQTRIAARVAFTRYITDHKLRKTPERFAILDKVFDIPPHFSVDELYEAISSNYHVSRSTVYNTVELLLSAGLLRRHVFEGNTTKYERKIGPSSHHHLICRVCGKVKEIKGAEIDKFLESVRFGSFHPLYADLNVYGFCSKCYKKTRPKKQINRIIPNKK